MVHLMLQTSVQASLKNSHEPRTSERLLYSMVLKFLHRFGIEISSTNHEPSLSIPDPHLTLVKVVLNSHICFQSKIMFRLGSSVMHTIKAHGGPLTRWKAHRMQLAVCAFNLPILDETERCLGPTWLSRLQKESSAPQSEIASKELKILILYNSQNYNLALQKEFKKIVMMFFLALCGLLTPDY